MKLIGKHPYGFMAVVLLAIVALIAISDSLTDPSKAFAQLVVLLLLVIIVAFGLRSGLL